ncbi:hypothetical protein [Brachyspira aalborgi]|uniref:Uncharacterized protein n=1 Tax=Brachyspira aalborgi TaxID=29522 RepID=A0A5C8EIW7_9SPIR|nr:hypothetical protein [Brachyspira aalborgi]TXJ36964.1 hypothetical protein EPJ78_06430 [Brachyspira aalborgi]
MKWLNILFTVLSSANMIGDIVRNNKFENKSKKLDRKIDEYEMAIIEKIDNKMKTQFVYINNQINSLKVVVRVLLLFSLLFFILFLLSLIILIFVLKYKNII